MRTLDIAARACSRIAEKFMSAYSVLLDQTANVIQQRARIFRNQVMTFVAVGGGLALAAIALQRLWPLAGLLALAPVCGGFLWFDAGRVVAWRSAVFAAWARRDVDLLVLAQMLLANPSLPNQTVQGMLGSLAAARIGSVEARACASVRHALAANSAASDALFMHRFAAKIGAVATALAGIAWAAALQTWAPLIMAVLIPLWLVVPTWCANAHRRTARKSLRAARERADFEIGVFCELLDLLPLDASTAYLLRRDCQAAPRNEYSF